MLAKLGPLDTDAITDLRSYLDTVPDPRSPRGRWYCLTSILLICACAVICGAKGIDELAEWGQRAPADLLETIGVRPHPLRWRRTPSTPTLDRVLARIDGDALDEAIGAYLADRHQAATTNDTCPPSRREAIAVDSKALKGSARLAQARRHLLSAVTHQAPVTLAQAEIGSKTNETRHFRPLLEGLDLTCRVVTFDALHTVKAHLAWLVEAKKAHYIAVIKTNQPTAHLQISQLPWKDVAIAHSASDQGHGRRESRSIKTLAAADSLGGIALPHAKLAIRVHRRLHRRGARPRRRNCVGSRCRLPPERPVRRPGPRGHRREVDPRDAQGRGTPCSVPSGRGDQSWSEATPQLRQPKQSLCAGQELGRHPQRLATPP
ncbi:ISAs1 family transposase [Nocardiopsis synnemataformans]|uniref:ISAs1 family transposase n=1 Tax=Nocardiopsis synnemataformans TaxID=61305 RepID=UPI003EBEFA6D